MGVALGIAAFVVVTVGVFGLPFLVADGIPDWMKLPKSKRKFRRELLEYIEWERSRDMRRYGILYPTEAEWNDKNLAPSVRLYTSHPKVCRQRMLDDRGETELMQWVNQNDPATLRSKIAKLERELGFQ